MPSLAGSKLDKYEIIEEVGHGGMAVVYRGSDTVLEREVAVKVLHSHLADREESRARLQREALAVAKLRHDNILEIFDYSGSETDESYIVTEFIHGPTMRAWVDDSLDPRPTIAAMIVHRLCLALCEAHRAGIVHRDIKPENVMVRTHDGTLKLMDFGIAQIIDDQKLTLTGQLIGSPAYMAPELISGRPLDQRTDLFSLGILLYQLATGKLPFSGRNPHEVLNRIADGDYPPPATICPLVDRDLETIIAVALATSPDERFQSAETFAKELERYLEEMGVPASQEELRAYFEAPKTYVEALDVRVTKALMARAHTAAGDGQTARAIALLGRVLEIDGSHKPARVLLDKVRRRERRLRQLLLGAGALALTGLVAAGVMLIPELPDVGAKTETNPALAAADLDATAGTSPRTDGLATTPPEGDRPPNATIPEPGTTPTQSTSAGGTTPTGADTSKPVGASVRPPRPGRRPKRTNPTPEAPSTFACTLKLAEIPVNTARNHKLQVGRKTLAIDALSTKLELERATTASLTQGTWRGTIRLTPEACARGPVSMPTSPKAARVRLTGAPPNAVVRCVKGCAKKDIGANQAADKEMRPIPVGRTGSQRVTFKLQAEGHRPAEIERTVHSGSQTVRVSMAPRK